MNTKTIAWLALLISIGSFLLSYVGVDSTTGSSMIQEKSTFEKIVATGEIKVCYVPLPPSISKDPRTGKLSGFMIDVMTSIASEAEIEVEYIETTRGGFAADLNTKKCDVGLGFYPLLNRAKSISFSKPFYFIGNNVMVKEDSGFYDIDDLNKDKLKIAVIQGEFGHIYAEKFLPEATLIVLDASSDNTSPLLAVSAGQSDAGLIVDDVITEYIKVNNGVRKIAASPYSTTPDTFGVRKKDQELLNFLNTAIDMLQSSGTFEGLGKKYDSQRYTEKKEYISLQE